MDSMETIFKQHAKTVFKYLISLTRDEDLAEELTQETFYQATKNIDSFDGKSKVTTWLIGISKNVYYNYLRKKKSREYIYDMNIEYGSEESAENLAINKIKNVELMKALHNTKQPNKDVLYLRLFGDLSFKEIGEVMGQTENWARVTFYRAKNKLRKDLEDYE